MQEEEEGRVEEEDGEYGSLRACECVGEKTWGGEGEGEMTDRGVGPGNR